MCGETDGEKQGDVVGWGGQEGDGRSKSPPEGALERNKSSQVITTLLLVTHDFCRLPPTPCDAIGAFGRAAMAWQGHV
jgi:hypothetical protein